MNSRTWWSRWAEVGAWGISALAWGLSYTSQYVLARDDGYGALAVPWPLTVDLASLVAMLLALDMARRSLNALQAWAIAFGSALVMIGANVLMAWPDAIRWLCTPGRPSSPWPAGTCSSTEAVRGALAGPQPDQAVSRLMSRISTLDVSQPGLQSGAF